MLFPIGNNTVVLDKPSVIDSLTINRVNCQDWTPVLQPSNKARSRTDVRGHVVKDLRDIHTLDNHVTKSSPIRQTGLNLQRKKW